MKLHHLKPAPGSKKSKIRVGRGEGGRRGKTAGRGTKGSKARGNIPAWFEGGQMPIYRRLPKRGFTNAPFRKEYSEVNLGRLQAAVDAKKLDPKKTVDAAALVEAGVITRVRKHGIRVLAKGELKASLTLDVAGASKAAIAAVEKAGGKVNVAAPAAEAAPAKDEA